VNGTEIKVREGFLLFNEKKYAWLLISSLWFFSFFGSIGRFVQSYYQNDISEYLDVGRGFLGFTWSINLLISALCAPVGGILVDKYGYKKVMLGSAVIANIAILTVLFANTSFGYFIGFGILSGLGGLNVSSIYVLVTNWFKKHRAKALMIASSAGSLGLAVLTPIFVYFQEWLNWMKLYWILLIIGWGFILFILFFVRKNEQEDEISKESNIAPPVKKENKIFENAKNWFPNIVTYCKNPVIVIVMISLFTCGFNRRRIFCLLNRSNKPVISFVDIIYRSNNCIFYFNDPVRLVSHYLFLHVRRKLPGRYSRRNSCCNGGSEEFKQINRAANGSALTGPSYGRCFLGVFRRTEL
jgi:MFS family permease